MKTPARPVMRYHGAKWKMAPQIISHFPAHGTYVEPYGGSGAVLLRKPRAVAEVYNDVFEDVVNVFRVLRDPVLAERLRDACHLTPYARSEFEAPIDRSDPVEWARGVVFRSFSGYGSGAAVESHNTGFRSRRADHSPNPASDWSNWTKHVAALTERLRGVVIENRDALSVMSLHDGLNTLHYLDPPYVHATRYSSKKKVYAQEMDDSAHREMVRHAQSMQGMVAISGYRCELYDDLLSSWRRVDFEVLADGAKPRTESLWMNYPEPSALPATQGSLFGSLKPSPHPYRRNPP